MNGQNLWGDLGRANQNGFQKSYTVNAATGTVNASSLSFTVCFISADANAIRISF